MGPGVKKTFSLLGIFLAAGLTLRFALPLLFPFLLGTVLALGAEPMVSLLNKRLGVPRGISAGIAVTMVFCFAAVVLLTLCALLIRELGVLAGILPDLEAAARSGLGLLQSWFLGLAGKMPQGIGGLLSRSITGVFSDGAMLVEKGAGYLLGLAGNLLRRMPDSALSLGTAVIAGYMISAKLPRIRRWVRRRLPREKSKPLLEAVGRMKNAMFGWLTAQFKLMGTTFLLLLLGLVLLRVPYGPVWAAVIALVDALPVLGTGTVLLPWAAVCFLQGDGGRGVGLLGIYAVITLTRSILEPKLLGRQLGLDPLVTLMVMYAGFRLWGIGGMILAPLLTVTALQTVPETR